MEMQAELHVDNLDRLTRVATAALGVAVTFVPFTDEAEHEAFGEHVVYDQDGRVLGAFCVVDNDRHEWTEAEREVLDDVGALIADAIELGAQRRERPMRDGLTGLPGRSLLVELASRSIDAASRDGGTTAIIALGLDGFRLVNEALGHAAGDSLLVNVAARLAGSLRPGDTVCRQGGDEFVVLCDRVQDEADALRITDRLLQTIGDEPYVIGGVVQPASATAGVATADCGVASEELVAAALFAMQRAKAGSADGVEHIDAIHQPRAGARLRMRNSVAQAHHRGEMSLVYQPLTRMSTGRVIGYEALLRWEHPELGPIAPDAFIPAAEQSGAIVSIGEWVLARATADLARWRSIAPAHDLHVAVNVAPAQIAVPAFAQTVADTLDDAGLPPNTLTLEVTERTLLADRAVHRDTLIELRDLGVRLSLDDFGTGFSALSYLSRFPLDDLKVDQIFTCELPYDPQTTSIVEGILAMARALGLRTVAEGIERPEQLTALQRLGCEVGQGFHLGRPLPAERIESSLDPRRF